jgi:Galactose oxidase, central domain
MTTTRAAHTATLLNNGMVLIVGGIDASDNALRSAELYNPSNNTFTATGSMVKPRTEHVATLLNDGRVLIAGGEDNSENAVASAEIYNPGTGSFGATVISMSDGREDPSIATLFDGRVLVAGGKDDTAVVETSEIYDPNMNTFTKVKNTMTSKRWRTGYNYSEANVP